jgi:excisionase family DNA binding protein
LVPRNAGTDNDLLSVGDVARRFDVQPITVYRWCREGRLRCLKPGKSWRIRRSDLDAFLLQSQRPQTLQGHLERFLTVPDQVLTVAEDPALLTQFDAAFFQAGAARDARLVKFYDRRAVSHSVQRAALQQHGLDMDSLDRQGRFRWCPETSLEGGVASLRQILTEDIAAEQPVWVNFDWPSVGDMEAKLRQQESLAALISNHPRLVVSTGVVEPEPDAWPPIQEQWQLLGSLRGLIRYAHTGLLLSRVVKLPSA